MCDLRDWYEVVEQEEEEEEEDVTDWLTSFIN